MQSAIYSVCLFGFNYFTGDTETTVERTMKHGRCPFSQTASPGSLGGCHRDDIQGVSNLERDAIFFSVGRKESVPISKSPAGAFPTWPLQNPSQNLAFYELDGNGIQTRALFK